MLVKVRFIPVLKEVAGTQVIIIGSSFTSLEKVIKELLKLYPQLKNELFNADGTMHYICHMMLNGMLLSWPEDKDIKVKDGEELLFLTFMAGG